MIKYLKLLGLIPFVFTLFCLKENDTDNYMKTRCFSILLSLLIYTILYLLLVFMKVSRRIAIIIGIIMMLTIIYIEIKIIA